MNKNNMSEMVEQYKIKTVNFEGPLELLLELIGKRKLFINDISLGQVADDYIKHIENIDDFPRGEVANFILIASILVLIKSKSLLPTLNLSEEEKENIEDLEKRLKLYKKFKELSSIIDGRFGKQIIFTAETKQQLNPIFSPDRNTNLVFLLQSILEVVGRLPKREKLPEKIVEKVISLEETMNSLVERIQTDIRLSFKSFSSKIGYKRTDVIVSFLAMLELVRRGALVVKQEEKFGDINMESQNTNLPNYS